MGRGTSGRRTRGWLLAGLATAAALSALPARAQQVRGTAYGTVRYYELRPLQQDTVPRSQVTQEPDGRLTYQGHPVNCERADLCFFFRTEEPVGTAAATQDLELTGWGFPVRGLSFTTLLRFRQDLSGDLTLPRTDDAFDLILGYAELYRGAYRVRLGRQRTLSGLGFSAYDGLELRLDPLDRLHAIVYGGRSLARGLEEERDEALAPLENFVPDRSAVLLGAAVGGEPWPGTGAELRYQREILSDRSVLLSERAALDLHTSALRPLVLEGSVDYDVAFDRIGKARLSATLPVLSERLTLEATARRYLPYFELWTIWGFFSPVAYHEAELAASARWGRFAGRGSVAWRAYEDHEAPVIREPLEDHALRAELALRAGFGSASMGAEYRLERGFGAYLSSGTASAAWRPVERVRLSVFGTANQQFLEFRRGDWIVLGLGGDVRVEAFDRLALVGGASLYDHAYDDRRPALDWSQQRAWLSLEVGFGREPVRAPAIDLEGMW